MQIAAPAGCEDDARAFYRDLVGFPELEKPETLKANGGCWFAVGEQELHVGVEHEFAPARKAHPAFRLATPQDLEELAGRLGAGGVQVEWDDRLPGVRRFYSVDPWGNRLEFLARDAR